MIGLNTSIRAKIFISYTMILICLVLTLLIVMNRVEDLQKEVNIISKHDMEVHNLVNQIQKNILDMETGMRGFALTGNEEYLEPYHVASQSWQVNYHQLHSMLEENSGQQRNLEKIRPLILSWITNSGEYVIQQKRANNVTALNEHFDNNTGKKRTDQIRTQFETLLSNQIKLATERISMLNQSNTNLKITLYVIIILVTVITISTAFILSNSIVKPIRQVVKYD